jgi:hypothetical protein
MIDPAEAPPEGVTIPVCMADETKLLLGPCDFKIDQKASMLGYVSGFRYCSANTLDVRRILMGGKRFAEVLNYAREQYGEAISLGTIYYVGGKIAYGYWFTEIELVDQREEVSSNLKCVEDVLILRFKEKIDITSQLQS